MVEHIRVLVSSSPVAFAYALTLMWDSVRDDTARWAERTTSEERWPSLVLQHQSLTQPDTG